MSFFTSPTSNISKQPSLRAGPVLMSRSDSHGSTATTSSSTSSAAAWLPSPFRSCLQPDEYFSSSYFSDDELLSLDKPSPSPSPSESEIVRDPELSTEEQINLLQRRLDREDLLLQQQRQRTAESPRHQPPQRGPQLQVQAPAPEAKRPKSRGSDGGSRLARNKPVLKKRTTAARRNLADLGN